MAGGERENASNGILGNAVLRHFNLLFDHPNKRLYLMPNQNFSSPLGADRSGLQIRPHLGGGIIRSIAPASAAAASPLQVGDVITSFDGETVTYETVGDLKRALESAKESVNLCWLSKGQERCEDLALESRF